MTEDAKRLRRVGEKMDRIVEVGRNLTDADLPEPSRTREHRPDETPVEMLEDRLDAVNDAFVETYDREIDGVMELIENGE